MLAAVLALARLVAILFALSVAAVGLSVVLVTAVGATDLTARDDGLASAFADRAAAAAGVLATDVGRRHCPAYRPAQPIDTLRRHPGFEVWDRRAL